MLLFVKRVQLLNARSNAILVFLSQRLQNTRNKIRCQPNGDETKQTSQKEERKSTSKQGHLPKTARTRTRLFPERNASAVVAVVQPFRRFLRAKPRHAGAWWLPEAETTRRRCSQNDVVLVRYQDLLSMIVQIEHSDADVRDDRSFLKSLRSWAMATRTVALFFDVIQATVC